MSKKQRIKQRHDEERKAEARAKNEAMLARRPPSRLSKVYMATQRHLMTLRLNAKR